MLGQNPTHQQQSLFCYRINLEQRVSAGHPLRQIDALLDLSFVVPAVRHFYGRSGNVSLDPVVIVKLMFLLFYYDIPSERELMEQLAYRMDFLWFVDFNLDSAIPDHSVLSKARARWGSEVFKTLFVRTVQQCVQAGLVDGRLLHVDSTIVKANASKDSICQLPEFLSQLYRQEERKLELLPAVWQPSVATAAAPVEPVAQPDMQSEMGVLKAEAGSEVEEGAKTKEQRSERVSLTDPDAQLARAKNNLVELSYKEHRVLDDAQGVITAVELTR